VAQIPTPKMMVAASMAAASLKPHQSRLQRSHAASDHESRKAGVSLFLYPCRMKRGDLLFIASLAWLAFLVMAVPSYLLPMH
jgi:hypothetical protein